MVGFVSFCFAFYIYFLFESFCFEFRFVEMSLRSFRFVFVVCGLCNAARCKCFCLFFVLSLDCFVYPFCSRFSRRRLSFRVPIRPFRCKCRSTAGLNRALCLSLRLNPSRFVRRFVSTQSVSMRLPFQLD